MGWLEEASEGKSQEWAMGTHSSWGNQDDQHKASVDTLPVSFALNTDRECTIFCGSLSSIICLMAGNKLANFLI